jgi:hypothetical protein
LIIAEIYSMYHDDFTLNILFERALSPPQNEPPSI